jgi:hypothetical protein
MAEEGLKPHAGLIREILLALTRIFPDELNE